MSCEASFEEYELKLNQGTVSLMDEGISSDAGCCGSTSKLVLILRYTSANHLEVHWAHLWL